MSRIRLYLDEDTINASLVKALRNADLDVVTVADAQRLGLSDEEQLLWAMNQGRVLYSYNIGDFCQLHSTFIVEERSHAGIILAPQRQFQLVRGCLKSAKHCCTRPPSPPIWGGSELKVPQFWGI